jgi:hypothetical protein
MRQPKMYSIFAKPGSGKTYKLIQLLRARVAKGDRAIVIDPDGAEDAWDQFTRYDSVADVPDNFKGIVVVEYHEGKTFSNIYARCTAKKLKNFMLVLDDPNIYSLPSPEDELANLLRRKRQYSMDILTTSHGWSECPQAFLRFIDIYILGPTDSSPRERSALLGRTVMTRHERWKLLVDQHKRTKPNEYPWVIFQRDGQKIAR